MSNRIRIFLIALTAVLLVACQDASIIDTGAGTGTTTPPGTPAATVPSMGNVVGTTYTAGVIGISTTTLSSGGSTGLTVSIVDTANGNAPISEATTVTFSSPCLSAGDATLSVNPVDTATGTASTTYTQLSCSGTDRITATASVSGNTLVATGSVTTVPAPASTIVFDTATPTDIGLQGSGQPDTSTVSFLVRNTAGGPVRNQDVTFSLDTTVGGITLAPATATTDTQGRVQSVVRAGTVPTSVRVTARLLDNALTTSFDESTVPPAASDSLVISIGLADQDSFSISVGCFNIEGGDYNGTTTNVNIHAADRFNNPVPDGTAIAFRAEGGQIQSSCLTGVGGAPPGNCSVDFTSQNPRPANHRVTILATAIGEESFNDINGDGRFNTGETFTDLGEAFLDVNEDATRQASEPFLDFNNNGSFTAGSTTFTGVLCVSGCDTASSLHARASTVIIMSGSTADIDISPAAIDLSGGPVLVSVLVGDDAGQPMPGGTTIKAATTLGTIAGTSTFTQACTTFDGPFPYGFVVQPPSGSTSGTGVFTIEVTTPGPDFSSGDSAPATVTTAGIPVSFSGTPPPPPPPPGTLGAIQFIAATPTTIGIQGSGLPDTSTVQFKVLSTTGVPITGQSVTFSLNTTVGGITFDPVSDTTDANGFVRTIVNSGTVHTSVRVTATATQGSTTVTAVSEQLTITTGLPDQNSFSLSAECFNVEALGRDNVAVPVLLLAADRFNNPVPDGTAVAFTTEGGAIEGDCLSAGTIGGECTVTWRSQNPRPAGLNGCTPGSDATCSILGTSGASRPGRSTILATALGEESFIDLNGDGRFDTGEPFGDLGEAFRDDDGDGARDAAFEEFLDFNNNGSFTAGSGTFTGTLCDSGCDTATQLHVRDSITIVMSGSSPAIDDTVDVSVVGAGTSYSAATNTFTIPENSFASLLFVIRDSNDQPMPATTSITFTATGPAGAIPGNKAFDVPCTTNDTAAGNTYGVGFATADVTTDQFGTLELEVVTPSGLKTIFGFGVVADFVPKCSDGVDNDADGMIDFAGDAGCANAADDSE